MMVGLVADRVVSQVVVAADRVVSQVVRQSSLAGPWRRELEPR